MQLKKISPIDGYFDSFDGLRAIAVLLVMLNHFVIPLPQALEFLRSRGHLGVEIFFAISGFLVIRSLHICFHRNNGSIKNTIKEFYIRRGARIFFPYYLILLTILILSYFVGSLHEKIASISDILPSFLFYFYNYAKPYTTGSVPGALNIMWSLSFEEQFYLLLGFSFLFFRNHLQKALILLCISSIIVRFATALNSESINFLRLQFETHMRLDAILFGCLVYLNYEVLIDLFKRSKVIQSISLLGSGFAFYISGVLTSPLGIATSFFLTALFFTSFILYLRANEGKQLDKILSWKPLVKTGKISYEIYLTHQIVNALLIKVGLSASPILYSFLLVSVTIAISWIFYSYINLPTQNFIRRRMIKKS